MNRLLIVLLAEIETADPAAEKAASGASSFEWGGLAAVAVMAILITLGYWLSRRWRAARVQQMLNSPAHLLQELCIKHGLGRGDQRLVATLAREQRLTHPGLLFVEPRLWESGKIGALGKRYVTQLDRLREQIFNSAR